MLALAGREEEEVEEKEEVEEEEEATASAQILLLLLLLRPTQSNDSYFQLLCLKLFFEVDHEVDTFYCFLQENRNSQHDFNRRTIVQIEH